MDKFNWCFQMLLNIEGGFSNEVADRGGATKYGITVAFLSAYLGQPATEADVRALTPPQCFDIYKKMIWDALSLEHIRDVRVAYMIFDQVVNRGPRPAIKNLQECLNRNLDLTDLKEDGAMGPRTIAIINDQVPELLGMWYCERCQESYARIVEYNQSQLGFLRGWLARTQKIQRLFWDKGKQ